MYMALYRKYRPMDFKAVIGQEHITDTLKSEIKDNKVAHAYLFTGTRGTGKTTCARLLAKAVNCLNLQNGEPCNECENCKGINQGTILDVIEIDAASNTGVDNIRDIREEAVYTPASGKKKVYIIDEVHMLSIGAFNALLKMLEEPPHHVMFILATTEAYKIAPTILSRCQRFDFKRITPEDIAGRLAYVCQQEAITITREALFLIGRLGDGSMRDALSILDTCCGSGQEITYDFVAKTVGVTGKENIYNMVTCIARNDIGGVLLETNRLYESCKGVALLASELTACFRNLMVIKAVKEPKEVLGDYEYELEALTKLAKLVSLERIIYGIDTLQDLQNTLQRSQNQRIDFEITLFKLCDPKLSTGTEALLARIENLEKKLESGSFGVMNTMQTPKAIQKEEVQQQKAPIAPQKPNTEFKKLQGWKEILAGVTAVVGNAYASLLKEAKAYIEGNTVYIVCTSPVYKAKYEEQSIKQTVEKAIAEKTGFHVNIVPVLKEEFEGMGRVKSEKTDPFSLLLDENKNNNHLLIEE